MYISPKLKYIFVAMAPLAAVLSVTAAKIEVSNTSDRQRNEIAEVSISNFETLPVEFILKDEKGREVQYQLTYDGKLIFPVSIGESSNAVYTVEDGKPSNKFPVYVYGRQFPERKDDFAWENDRSAYRAYGPALERSGEKAYGYDIWSKSVSYPVLEQRFYDDRVRRISFHDDHGNGLDGYAVGPTLGGGTAALLSESGEIIYPYCYKEFEMLDEGPLRVTVKLTYNPIKVDGESVTETRIISLDKGSWLNKTTLRYDGLKTKKNLAQGIVVHSSNPKGYEISDYNKFVGYTDMTDKPEGGNGEIYVGIVSPSSTSFRFIPIGGEIKGVEGHVAAVADYKPGEELTYWWGSGWSKGGVKDSVDWSRIMTEFSENLSTPLVVKVSK